MGKAEKMVEIDFRDFQSLAGSEKIVGRVGDFQLRPDGFHRKPLARQFTGLQQPAQGFPLFLGVLLDVEFLPR